MTAKLVVRLLDPAGQLLGWCAHEAAISGDGYLRAAGSVVLAIDVEGTAAAVSVHWADVNVETRVSIPQTAVKQGQALVLFEKTAPMVKAGDPPATRLPPVSTKSIAVPVPVGMLGAVSVA